MNAFLAQSKWTISIHALREEGDVSRMHALDIFQSISIHALREEGDPFMESVSFWLINFYPRPPRGGRPAPGPGQSRCIQISIHALREEGDRRRRCTEPHKA